MQPNNNYDFIMNPATPPKKAPMGSNSMAMRILIVVGGLFLLAIIAAVFMSFIGNAGSAFNKSAMLSVAQDQTEIQRLASIGEQDSVSQTNKNFSATTTLSIKSEQSELLTFLASNGYTVDPKQLPLKQDAAATSQLESAKSASTFDDAYKKTMQKALQTYQSDLKAAYDDASSDEAKKLLSDSYERATLLLTQLNAGN